MKVTRHALLAGLLYAALGVALPFQIVLTSDTPTIRFKDSSLPAKRLPEPVHEKPSFKQYIEQVREAAQTPVTTATATLDIESSTSEQKPGHAQSESESDTERDRAFRDHYGAVLGKLGKFISNEDISDAQPAKNAQVQHNQDHHTPTSSSRTITYLKPVDLLDIIDKHGPECVALAIFVLVPIAYFLLELLELAIGCCVHERFPRRGRDRVRLLGPERQIRAWSNRQREQFLESEKHWWQVRKTRC
ncbi:uncharacterized protein N7473_009335 [Penicillium subrubescens]|jgi:hypothetical protein|uniref:Uncharacterized protein n=1 Tax=Penicillium subrubescens TaxID=1316194 RepID=A0A1Q5TB10_9EURO|nr:uncharacterized protein N7473_009335 [Penicillium subrubescens]KAJ5886661.1 hypothetical protein N7473_009335 [Penicillium subrubescens]OKO97330.1 hypothetical protein PENSUB_10124 [Penicillium subrubescens]